MQKFYEYSLNWEVDWELTNNGKLYTESQIAFLKEYAYCKTLKNFASDCGRKISAIALKLKKLSVLHFDCTSQQNWNAIFKHQDSLTVKELQNYLSMGPWTPQFKKSAVPTQSQLQQLNTDYEQKEILSTDDKFIDSCIAELKTKDNVFSSLVKNSKKDIENTTEIYAHRSSGLETFKINLSTKNEKNTMKRRTVIVELFDDNKGLDVKHSRVFSKEIVTESEDNNSIIQQMLLEADSDGVSNAIKAHNKLRSETVDEKILQNTGNSVMLREVKIEDLRWSIR